MYRQKRPIPLTPLLRRLACVALLLVASRMSPASGMAQELASKVKRAGTCVSLNFEPDERLVFIPVRLGVRDYKFAVDTGCRVCVFDASFGRTLGHASVICR